MVLMGISIIKEAFLSWKTSKPPGERAMNQEVQDSIASTRVHLIFLMWLKIHRTLMVSPSISGATNILLMELQETHFRSIRSVQSQKGRMSSLKQGRYLSQPFA